MLPKRCALVKMTCTAMAAASTRMAAMLRNWMLAGALLGLLMSR